MTQMLRSSKPMDPGATWVAAQAMQRWRAMGGRRTTGRMTTLQILATHAPRHLTAPEIHKRLHHAGWPAEHSSVCRTLNDFTDAGLTHTLAAPGPVAYGLSDPAHHHAVCSACESITEIPTETLAAVVAGLEEVAHSRMHLTGITLNGSCVRCRT